MRRIIATAFVFIMLVSALAGCGRKSGAFVLPKGMSGSDAAKLLLAGERLDAQLLKKKGDIFENGAEVMNSLARKAKNNLAACKAGSNITSLSFVQTSKETISGPNTRGTLIKDGDTFIWSDFVEYNNSYEYFENLTNNIIISAEIAAELIDNVKKNVRVLDKWVAIDEVKYYLRVEENSELLIEHYTGEGHDIVNICTRYKNPEGKDVYELYRGSTVDQYEERMTYIPGERYELSMKHNWGGEEGMDCFIADNSKGFWETCVLGIMPDHNNVSYFVMKDNLCYDAIYDANFGSVNMIKVMSSDRATDIFNISAGENMLIDLNFAGFDGIKTVEAKAQDVEYNREGGYANIPSGEVATVNFANGKKAKCGDTFVDGKVSVGSIHVMFSAGEVYSGTMSLNIKATDQTEQFELFKQFINEVGLSCRRNVDSVIAGVNAAFIDVESFKKYYKWNGFLIADNAGIAEAKVRELERFDAIKKYYNDVKDTVVIDINDTELVEMNINFAPITEGAFNGVRLDNMRITVENAALTINDTTLYVQNEPYKIVFALENSNGGLIHFDIENSTSTKYAEGESFTVTASALEFTLPVLAPGNYTLVSYIATSEGIRASGYTPVFVDGIDSMPVSFDNISVSATKSEGGTLILSYTEKKDFTVVMTTESKLGYEDFKTALSELTFNYGTPADIIEVLSDGVYTALTGEETEIADGTYRISYKVENGNNVIQGYIFVQYSCK